MARRKKRRARGRRRNGLAFLVNPGRRRKRSKARRRNARRVNARRRYKRRKRNPGAMFMLANPRRKYRRRKRNARRRNPFLRRRRNARRIPNAPKSLTGIKNAFMGHVKHDVPGGAIAGVLDLYLVDGLAKKVPYLGTQYAGAAKILVGIGAGIACSHLGPLRKFAPGVVAGFAALGAKQLIAQFTGHPYAAVGELVGNYGALVSNGSGMLGTGSGVPYSGVAGFPEYVEQGLGY